MAKLMKPKKLKKLKFKKLDSKVRNLAKRGVIGPKQLGKLRGSEVAPVAPRGGVGAGMAGK